MSKKKLELSRRKTLAALGTIGAASTGAGLGTSAFFSDQESFENNTLTAGELDLTVDWEEHYWNDFALESAPSFERVEGPGDLDDGQVGLPDPQNPLVAVDEGDLEAFMDATAIEAFPDTDDDGVQDDLANYDACQDFAQLPEGLDPDAGPRTRNEDTVDNWPLESGEDAQPNPLVNLGDVKPGDFGELTLSFHLCDNPGYVWLQGEPVSAAEDGHTEPEGEASGESGPSDETVSGEAVLDSDVELLDEIQTMLWYDEDGDNVFEPGGEEGEDADVVLVLDRSGSMGGSRITEAKTAAKNLVDALNLGANAAQVGVVSFADEESLNHELSTDASSVKDAIDDINTGGSTNIEGGVNGGEEELTGVDHSTQVNASGNARSGARKIMVVLSDGSPNVDDGGDDNDDPSQEAQRAKNNDIELFTIGFGINSGSDTAETLEDMASDPADSHFYLGGAGELEQIFGQIGQQISGEELFFSGTLRELLDAASSDNGIPLDGDRATSFDETGGQDAAEARDEFVDSTNNFVGLAWWIPRGVGNQIQGDSVGFDLGFYTQQSRHNDGSGPNSTQT